MTTNPLDRYTHGNDGALKRQRLRVMKPNEVFDTGFQIYQSLGKSILSLTFGSALVVLAGVLFCTQIAFPMFGQTSNPESIQTQVGEVMFALCIVIFGCLPLVVLGMSYTCGVVAQIVSDYMVANVPDLTAGRLAGWRGMRVLPRLAVRQMGFAVVSLSVSFGLLLLSAFLEQSADSSGTRGLVVAVAVIGFFVAFVSFFVSNSVNSLAIPIIIVEGLPAKEAMIRSRALMKSGPNFSWGYDVLGTLGVVLGFLFLLLWGGFGSLLNEFDSSGLMAGLIGQNLLGELIRAVISILPPLLAIWIIVPIWAATVTVLYYERRVRWEGFDIEALARDVWRIDQKNRFQL